MSSTTPWFIGGVIALVVSFVMTVEVQGAVVGPKTEPRALPGITLVTSGNTVSLSTDASAGDVHLTSTNATITVQCSGCTGITGQGTSSVLIPGAGNNLSNVTVTLTAATDAGPQLTARQGGSTASVSLGSSFVSSVTTTSSGGSAFASGGSASVAGATSTFSGSTSSSAPGGLLSGGGLGLFVFSGGRFDDLPATTGCPASRLAVWAADRDGGFLVFIPGALVDVVNEAFREFFADGLIPAHTPLVGRCG